VALPPDVGRIGRHDGGWNLRRHRLLPNDEKMLEVVSGQGGGVPACNSGKLKVAELGTEGQ